MKLAGIAQLLESIVKGKVPFCSLLTLVFSSLCVVFVQTFLHDRSPSFPPILSVIFLLPLLFLLFILLPYLPPLHSYHTPFHCSVHFCKHLLQLRSCSIVYLDLWLLVVAQKYYLLSRDHTRDISLPFPGSQGALCRILSNINMFAG